MRLFAVLCGLAALTLTHALPAPFDTAASTDNSTTVHSSMLLASRDIFTDMRGDGTDGDGPMLTSVGSTPPYAFATTIPVGPFQLFAWQSKTPNNERNAESVFIILHGIERNAGTYFRLINSLYSAANDLQLGSAVNNSIRLSPLFFSTQRDAPALNATTLAWDDPNAWTGGDGSTHPLGSNVSLFSAYDALLLKYADRVAYPKMKTITFLGHGGGAQVVQRYAVLGRENPAKSRISVRYVVADPSSMLYFTPDRPVPVNTTACSWFNDFRYGLSNYRAPYLLLTSSSALFKRYAKRDVRYVVGLDDVSTTNGDQLCGGRAAGGAFRYVRSLAYFKYLNLLGGARAADFDILPGTFPALDSREKANATYPTSSGKDLRAFRKTKLGHKLVGIHGAGHSAEEVFGSADGMRALFLPAASLPAMTL